MSIIENLKEKKVIKRERFSVKIDVDVKSDLVEVCKFHEIKIDDFVNEVLRSFVKKEKKKLTKNQENQNNQGVNHG
ncbi:MAG: hypothetical protein GQ570_15530 [Helicobacteraceae bacterium]|nr:hypothetical protein [Helicobacteraceae bacterium]